MVCPSPCNKASSKTFDWRWDKDQTYSGKRLFNAPTESADKFSYTFGYVLDEISWFPSDCILFVIDNFSNISF